MTRQYQGDTMSRPRRVAKYFFCNMLPSNNREKNRDYVTERQDTEPEPEVKSPEAERYLQANVKARQMKGKKQNPTGTLPRFPGLDLSTRSDSNYTESTTSPGYANTKQRSRGSLRETKLPKTTLEELGTLEDLVKKDNRRDAPIIRVLAASVRDGR